MSEILGHKGNYKKLLVYRIAVIISVATEFFVAKFIPPKSRTTDQMQQAARSCKQNIVEGNEAAKTSSETEIKLTNVARASLAELLEDYIDYLRFHSFHQWDKANPRTQKLRDYLKSKDFEENYTTILDKMNGEEFCNLMITLIHQEMYLLDKLLSTQERRFIESGGIREKMSRARREYRRDQRDRINRSNQSNQINQSNRSDLRDWSK